MTLTAAAKRRTYKTVDVATAGDACTIRLDGKPLRTPLGTVIEVPAPALAAAIAREWDSQGETLDLAKCPLTRIAGTALDLVPRQRASLVAELAAYADTELICHRAERPPALARRQHEAWQPLLDWMRARFDAHLEAVAGIVPRAQSVAARAAVERAVAACDDLRLAALALAVHSAGSVVIGLAMMEHHLDAAGAFDAAELDATFQIEAWGEDTEASRRRAIVRADLEAAARFFALLA